MEENLFVYVKEMPQRFYKITTFAENKEQADMRIRASFQMFCKSGRRGLTADEIDERVYAYNRACAIPSVVGPILKAQELQRPDGDSGASCIAVGEIGMDEKQEEVAHIAILSQQAKENKLISAEIRVLQESGLLTPYNIPKEDLPCTHLRGSDIRKEYHGRRGERDIVEFTVFGKDKQKICDIEFKHGNLVDSLI
jgi:hypothetical protein